VGHFDMGIKKAEFDADFKSVLKSVKKFLQKIQTDSKLASNSSFLHPY
jgi:hypothetical protein